MKIIRWILLTGLAVSLLTVDVMTVSAANRTACTRFYTIRKGETLSRVARRFGTTSNRLIAWNGLGSAVAKRGMTICVRASVVASAVTTRYTVKKGDTLASIAKKYGSNVAEIQKLNRVRKVKQGQTLLIPLRKLRTRAA
jgi:LysM repeat protein